MEQYLESSEFIDWKHPTITKKAAELAESCTSDEATAKKCFEFVRDSVQHSWDYRQNPVTCKASDVLLYGTGYCYAKSHLLAALLRANGIPAGLCYQRLTIESNRPPYSLHGLNAVYLKQYGWYRIDARGNKSGVAAEFSPPVEKIAFSIACSSERDFPEIWAEPLPSVVKALTKNKTVEEVFQNLPDVEVLQANKSLNQDKQRHAGSLGLKTDMPDIIGIDHIYVTVSDIKKSEPFYDAVMGVLGFRKNQFQLGGEKHVQYYNRYFGYVLRPARSIRAHDPYAPGLHHFCLRVESENEVKEAALRLREQNISVSEPRLYPDYAPDYFAVYLVDPDGMRLEITNYRQERRQRHDNWQNIGP